MSDVGQGKDHATMQQLKEEIRRLTNSECSASSAFSSDKSSGTSESWAVVARLQSSVIRSATGRISTTTERSKRKGHKAIGSIL